MSVSSVSIPAAVSVPARPYLSAALQASAWAALCLVLSACLAGPALVRAIRPSGSPGERGAAASALAAYPSHDVARGYDIV